MIERQNPDGSWSPAEPMSMIGWKAKTEEWLRRWHVPVIPNVLARWDERGLGR